MAGSKAVFDCREARSGLSAPSSVHGQAVESVEIIYNFLRQTDIN